MKPVLSMHRGRPLAAIAAAILAGAASADGASFDDRPTGPVVELPPITVTASTRQVAWRYVRIPGFEVLSHTSDATTRAFVQGQYRAQQLLRLVLPDEFQPKLDVPATLLLSNPELTSSTSQDLLSKSSAPAQSQGRAQSAGGGPAGSPQGSGRNAAPLQPPPPRGGAQISGGRGGPPVPILIGPPAGSLDRIGRATASPVRFLSNLRLEDSDAVTTYAMLDERTFDGDLLVVAPTAVRSMLERRVPALPSWFVGGFCALYNMSGFAVDTVTIPALPWVTYQETASLRGESDYPRTLIPLKRLFEGSPPDATADPALGVLWNAESALFIRWALDGKDSPHRDAFWKFMARTLVGPVTESDVRECFGMTYADLRDELSDYLAVRAISNPIRLRIAKVEKLTVPRIRDATEAETARIKGDWQRLELNFVKLRHPEFADAYGEQAQSTFAGAYAAGVRDPGFMAVMGLYQVDIGNADAARPYLEAAAQGKVVRPRLYLELARMRFAAVKSQPLGANGKLSADQSASVIQEIEICVSQAPPQAAAYKLAAEVWMASGEPLTRQRLALLDSGVANFPRDLDLIFAAASLNAANGFKGEAAALAERGMKAANTPEARTRFEAFKTP